MSDTVGRIEQLTEEVRRDLELRHGTFAKLSPEFERRVAAEVERRLAEAGEYDAYRQHRLQAHLASCVDHRELLRKYILHTFTSEPVDSVSGESAGAFVRDWLEHSPDFTAEEKAELVRLAGGEAGC